MRIVGSVTHDCLLERERRYNFPGAAGCARQHQLMVRPISHRRVVLYRQNSYFSIENRVMNVKKYSKRWREMIICHQQGKTLNSMHVAMQQQGRVSRPKADRQNKRRKKSLIENNTKKVFNYSS